MGADPLESNESRVTTDLDESGQGKLSNDYSDYRVKHWPYWQELSTDNSDKG